MKYIVNTNSGATLNQYTLGDDGIKRTVTDTSVRAAESWENIKIKVNKMKVL